jgi:hypothetical protein
MADRDAEVALRLDGQAVAEYVVHPEVHPTLAPRPYLHPIRTLTGLVVTDAFPRDHRWHLGASLAMPDVSGTNLWGGRTYLRGGGYTWRDDHGAIAHTGFLVRSEDRLVERLRWCDRDGNTLLEEERRISVRPCPDRLDAWLLDVSYRLTAPPDRDITLASPASKGRPGGAGYGGFFWRAARTARPPQVFTASATGEHAVNGSTDPWVAMVSRAPYPYTLIFLGLGTGDRWFVRSHMYPGVCASFAFARPRVIAAGSSRTRRHTVVVADAVLSRRSAGRLAAAVATADDAGTPPPQVPRSREGGGDRPAGPILVT